jgi:hypothetical protein
VLIFVRKISEELFKFDDEEGVFYPKFIFRAGDEIWELKVLKLK